MPSHAPVSPRSRVNAKRMRKAMTEAELKLWNELRAHRLMGLGFRRQYPIGEFIVDFACPAYRLVVEVDGSQHGRRPEARKDAARSTVLQRDGWTVLRFWNDDVLRNTENVCNHIVGWTRERKRRHDSGKHGV